MFEEHQKGSDPVSYVPPAIALASGCVGVILSIGLCSIDARDSNAASTFLVTSGIAIFCISVLAIVVSVPWFIVAAIMNATRE